MKAAVAFAPCAVLAACGPSQIHGVVLGAVLEGDPEPLSGVEVCIEGAASCARSGDDGRYAVRGLPPDGNVVVTFTKEDHVGQLYARVGDRFDVAFDTALSSFTTYRAFLEDVRPDLVFPNTDGILFINEATHADGVAAELIEPTPSPERGPYYSHDGRTIARNASAVTADGMGFIFFTDLPEGDAQFRVLPSDTSPQACAEDDGGWAGDEDGSIRVPVRAGFETLVVTRCR